MHDKLVATTWIEAVTALALMGIITFRQPLTDLGGLGQLGVGVFLLAAAPPRDLRAIF
jgi:hypothetical protein